MVKQRKSRKAMHRRVNAMLAKYGKECTWWDGGYPECFLPWAHNRENGCKGNPFLCKKLYMKHLASAKKINVYALTDFEQRERNKFKTECR